MCVFFVMARGYQIGPPLYVLLLSGPGLQLPGRLCAPPPPPPPLFSAVDIWGCPRGLLSHISSDGSLTSSCWLRFNMSDGSSSPALADAPCSPAAFINDDSADPHRFSPPRTCDYRHFSHGCKCDSCCKAA